MSRGPFYLFTPFHFGNLLVNIHLRQESEKVKAKSQSRGPEKITEEVYCRETFGVYFSPFHLFRTTFYHTAGYESEMSCEMCEKVKKGGCSGLG